MNKYIENPLFPYINAEMAEKSDEKPHSFGFGLNSVKFSDLAKSKENPINIWAESAKEDEPPKAEESSVKISEQPSITGEELEESIFEVPIVVQ